MKGYEPISPAYPSPGPHFEIIEYHYTPPNFGRHVHIEVVRLDGPNSEYEIREYPYWFLDGRKSPHPEPTRACKLPSEVVAKLDVATRRLRISAIPPFKAGCDGYTCSLAITAGFNTISLSWWCEPENGWADLEPMVDSIIQAAQAVGIALPKPGERPTPP